jgi:hypothetical protein
MQAIDQFRMAAPPRQQLSPEMRLLAAIVVQALEDARCRPCGRRSREAQAYQREAREFLRSAACKTFCQLLDLNYGTVAQWVSSLS